VSIIVFGGSGRLGSAIIRYAKSKNLECISVGKRKKCDLNLDLTKKDVANVIKRHKPKIIFNCIALTDVNFCNKNILKAYNLNVTTITNLVKAIIKSKIPTKLIHISTDQVYNNPKKFSANSENNINLSNPYSVTKYLSELAALKYKNTLVIRTNFFGKSYLKCSETYTDYIKKNLIKKKIIKIADNIIFNPLNLETLVKNLFLISKSNLKGIFNLGSKNSISKFHFAKKVARKFRLNSSYLVSFKSDYEKDKRPLGTYMNVSKFEKKTKVKLPNIEYGISIL
tara:strand:+ start:1613 stop:2461 length:849 start_codon:yes stop_codon:yes gene_type:complete